MPAVRPALSAQAVLLPYGATILAFMGGCLWGFACRASDPPGLRELGLAVVPSLWAFSSTFHPAPLALLAGGFVVLLAIDTIFLLRRLAPLWWMALRLPLTAVAVLCLLAGAAAS